VRKHGQHVKHIAVLILLAGSACTQAGAATSLWQRLSHALAPLPYRYAHTSVSRGDFEATWQLLQGLMQPDDGLALMSPDGNYTVFRYCSPNKLIIDRIARASLAMTFPRLTERYERIWVVLNDPRLGWHAQPPGAYRGHIQNSYIKLPFNLPVYFTDRHIAVGSTNSWRKKAEILEQYVWLEPEDLNPKIFMELGQLYRRAGDLDKAIKQYNRGITLFPTDPFLHRALGECYYWQCKPPRIRESIKHNNLASYYHRQQYGRPMYDALFNVAIAYTSLDEREKALLQYNSILARLVNFPDSRMESQIRRYLANVYFDLGRTNDAVRQLEMDIQLGAQAPGYSYNKILDVYEIHEQTNEFKKLAADYFSRQNTNDLRSITRYTSFMLSHGSEKEITDMIITVRYFLKKDAPCTDMLREQTAWWRNWTNAAVSRSISPVD
jgi:tetratricopeptide (TPR) repeat protein